MPLEIYKRGKTYHYRGTVAGKLLRRSCKTTDPKIAAQIVAKIEATEWKSNIYGPEAVLTFAQAAELYEKAGKSMRFLEKIEDYWKDTLIKDIKPSAIRQMAMELYPNVSAATRNRQAITPCAAVINHSAEAELCPYVKVKKFKEEQKIKPPFTLEWVDSFCEQCDSPYLVGLVLFMFATGARISEALAVEWDNVNLRARTVIIPRTKIGEQRQVNLPTRVLAAIANMPKVHRRPIFWYRTGWGLRGKWETTIRRAGIQRMTPHSGRHGFATTMLRGGEDVKTVARLGGWKSAIHVLKTYAHAAEDITLNNVVFDSTEDRVLKNTTNTKSTQPMTQNQRKLRKMGTS